MVCKRQDKWLSPECPTFQPSLEEFADPLAFIASIRNQAEPYGLCRIQPPNDWRPPFALHKKTRVQTSVQSVHELQKRSAASTAAFHKQFKKFLKVNGEQGVPTSTVVSGREVLLCTLFRLVTDRGGYDKLTACRSGWKDVCRLLQVKDSASGAVAAVKAAYEEFLLKFERHLSRLKSAVKLPGIDLVPGLDGETGVQIAAQILQAILTSYPGSDDSEDHLSSLSSEDEPGPKRQRLKGESAKCIRLSSSSYGGRFLDEGRPMKVPANINTLMCELCGGGHREDKIILCDSCDRGCHMFCLNPPLQGVPDGQWVCPLCVISTHKSSATRPGSQISIKELAETANLARRTQSGSESRARKLNPEDIEAEFWRVVKNGCPPTEVVCSIDLDTTSTGSGFPQGLGEDYADDLWNPANLARLGGQHGNLLRHVVDHVPGVTSPRLQLGSMFSSRPWAAAPQLLYTMSYLHMGESKKWYCVPSDSAPLLEKVFQDTLPEPFKVQPDLLYDPETMLTPEAFHKAGVMVTEVLQEAGEIVITFPAAHFATVDQGFNCSEGICFAPADWLRFGEPCAARHRRFRQCGLVCHDQLLLQVLARDDAPLTMTYALPELRRVTLEQLRQRVQLWSSGVYMSRQVGSCTSDAEGSSAEQRCAVCKEVCYLAGLECDCCPGRSVCLVHSAFLCTCPPQSWRLVYRLSVGSLQAIADQHPAPTSDAAGDADNSSSVKEEQPCGGEDAPNHNETNQAACRTAPGDAAAAVAPVADAADDVAGQMNALGVSIDMVSALTSLSNQTETQEVAEPKPPSQSFMKGSSQRIGRGSRKKNAQMQHETVPERVPEVAHVPREAQSDHEALSSWHAECQDWIHHAKELLNKGTSKVGDLDAAVGAAQQLVWGPKEAAEVPALCICLQAARAFASAVNAAIKTKPSLESLQELLARDPPPLPHPGLPRLKEVAKQANAWHDKFQEAMHGTQPLKTLESLSTEASRCGVAMPEVEALRKRVNSGRRISEAIRAALSGQRDTSRPARSTKAAVTTPERLGAEYFRGLQAEAAAIQVEVPEAEALADALDALVSWQQRARASLAVAAPLEDLQTLCRESSSLAIQPPEQAAVQAVVDKAEAWLQRASEAAKDRVPLKKLREVLHGGLRLGVIIPQVDDLRGDIRKREWEDSAKKCLGAKASLAGLQEVVAEAAVKAASDSELLPALRERLRTAEAWDVRAAALLLPPRGQDESDSDEEASLHPSIATSAADCSSTRANTNTNIMTSHSDSGKDGSPSPMDTDAADATDTADPKQSSPEYHRRQHSCSASDTVGGRSGSGSLAVAGSNDTQRPTKRQRRDAKHVVPLSELTAVVEDGVALGLRLERLAAAQALLSAAQRWQEAATAVLAAADSQGSQMGQSRPQFKEVVSLIDAGRDMGLVLHHMDDLQHLVAAAGAWADEAKVHLALYPATAAQPPEALSAAKRLIQDCEAGGVEVDELQQLRSSVAAVSWDQSAARMLATLEHIESPCAQMLAASEAVTESAVPKGIEGSSASPPTGSRLLHDTPELHAHNLSCSSAARLLQGGLVSPSRHLAEPLQGQPVTVLQGEPFTALQTHLAAALQAQPAAASEAAQLSAHEVTRTLYHLENGALSVASTQPSCKPIPTEPQGASEEGQSTSWPGSSPASPLLADMRHRLLQSGTAARPASAQARLLPIPIVGGGPGQQCATTLLAPQLPASADDGLAGQPHAAAAALLEQRIICAEVAHTAAAADDAAEMAADTAADEAASVAAVAAVVPSPEMPSLSEAESLVAEARNLPVSAPLLTALRKAVKAACDWEAEAQQALGSKRGGGGRTSAADVVALIARGERVGLRLRALPLLRTALAKHAEWEARLQRVLSSGRRLLQTTAASLLSQAKASPLATELSEALATAVHYGTTWSERARKAVVKRNSGQQLPRGLAAIASSLTHASSQMAQMQEALSRAAGGEASGEVRSNRDEAVDSTHHVEDEASLYCLCQQPNREDTVMVRCDGCDEWLHLKCVGLSNAAAKTLRKYVCPLCAAIKGPDGKAELEQAIGRIRKTRRPSFETMKAVVKEAEELPCQPPEERQFKQLVAQYSEWQTDALKMVERHDTAVSQSQLEAELPVPVLTQLLKSCLSLEVDAGGLTEHLLQLLGSARWRHEAHAIMHSSLPPTVEALQKLIKDGNANGSVEADDETLRAAEAMLHAGRTWLARYAAACTALRTASNPNQEALAIEAAQMVLREATQVTVKLDKEVEQLKEAAAVYCLCDRVYDPDRPMVACDYCDGWFHFHCVGLMPPEEEEDEDDVVPADFRCPECCMKLACPYAHYHKLPPDSVTSLHAIAARLAERQQRSYTQHAAPTLQSEAHHRDLEGPSGRRRHEAGEELAVRLPAEALQKAEVGREGTPSSPTDTEAAAVLQHCSTIAASPVLPVAAEVAVLPAGCLTQGAPEAVQDASEPGTRGNGDNALVEQSQQWRQTPEHQTLTLQAFLKSNTY